MTVCLSYWGRSLNKVSGMGLVCAGERGGFFSRQSLPFLPLLLGGWTMKDENGYITTRGS
jgi:hypothetical protein